MNNPRTNGVGGNRAAHGGQVTTHDDGLTPVMGANMLAVALRNGWIDPSADWTAEERRRVIDQMLADALRSADVRGRTAAARVLATLERNVIADRRNQIAETGQELGAATDRLRATLGSPAALSAMAALSVAVTQTTQPQAPTEVAAPGVGAIGMGPSDDVPEQRQRSQGEDGAPIEVGQ